MIEFDVARMCGVSVLELDSVPEFRREQALVILRARAGASMKASEKAKTFIPPEFFMGL